MKAGEALAGHELVLRRFDPTDEKHCVIDDAGFPARLRQSAFKWDRFPERPEEAIRMECSVYHLATLRDIGLDVQDCIEDERPDWQVAALDVEGITTFKRQNMVDENPYDVVSDPYPYGEPGDHPRDEAHALIRHAHPQKGADKWSRDLALRFKILDQADTFDVEDNQSGDDQKVGGASATTTPEQPSDGSKLP